MGVCTLSTTRKVTCYLVAGPGPNCKLEFVPLKTKVIFFDKLHTKTYYYSLHNQQHKKIQSLSHHYSLSSHQMLNFQPYPGKKKKKKKKKILIFKKKKKKKKKKNVHMATKK